MKYLWALALVFVISCGKESIQENLSEVAATPPSCPGNFNGDNVVDGADFMVWQRENGKTGSSPADANQDGVVDNADLDIWKANNGKICPAAVTPPPVLNLSQSIQKLVNVYPYPTKNNFSVFSSYSATQGATDLKATWNPGFWAASVNLSPIAWHDGAGNPGRLAQGIAITPRHVLSHNQHAGEIPGSTLQFVRKNGEIITRKTSAVWEADASTYWRIMYMEEDLPEDMVAAMPMPDAYLLNKPIANLDQFGELHLQFVSGQTGSRITVNVMTDTHPVRQRYHKAPIGGDSGKPLFAIMNDEIVPLSFWWTGVGGSSVSVGQKTIFEAVDRLSVKQGDTRMLKPRLKKVY